MRATVEIDSDLLTQAKALALKEKKAFQSVIAEGLRLVLAIQEVPLKKKKPRPLKLRASRAKGGVRNGINLNSNSELRNIMDFS